MPAKKKTKKATDRNFEVGQQLRVKLHTGDIVDAKVRAVVPGKRVKLQVDYGNDETALVSTGQVVD